MDPFTWVLIVLAGIGVVSTVVGLVRPRLGTHIGLNAPMDSEANNWARLIQETNVHNTRYSSSGGGGSVPS